MHWADVIAEDLVKRSEKPLIATGISPTGVLHVGSLREAITGESIRSAVKSKGAETKLIYLIDAYDPLRRRYDFLPKEFEQYVGQPISDIPCPCGKHRNYAHHFIQPFLDAVDSLGVHCDIIWTNELYAEGKFAECIDKTFKHRQKIIDILHEVSGKDPNPDYAPYTPRCEECGKFVNPIFDSYEFPYVEYDCPCGHHGRADVRKADGKLTWRCEWPAKWAIFGTVCEPFGKDHAAAGGSYDTGVRIAEEVFGVKAPYPVPYEFVQLKGMGQMHKSTGSPVTGMDAIMMTPPEVLNYLFLRVQPNRAIDFDPGMGVLDMADEYDRMEVAYFTREFTESEENNVKAYEIAQHNNVPEDLPVQVSCRHLVNVVQMADGFEDQKEVIQRTVDLTEASAEDLARIEKRCETVRYWLDNFAPAKIKFSVLAETPDGVVKNDNDREVLSKIGEALKTCDWKADDIGSTISGFGKESSLGLKATYKLIYRLIIGKPAGPRLGAFLASMDREFVVARFAEAVAN